MSPARSVRIVQMGRHFLYLPLYFAHNQQYFGYVPAAYTVEITTARPHTDEAAYRSMMQETVHASSFIGFAVADPTCVLDDSPFSAPFPAILAGLITNAAFWAVDRRSRRVEFLRDLAQFDEIIAFAPGSTSYGIASRIWSEAKKSTPIRSVDPEKELTALTQSNDSTVALSPDILGIDSLISRESGDFTIKLVLGTTPEYANVLVTALLSRRDVVDEHRELASGLVKALQRSMDLVRFEAPEVIQFAADYFNHPTEEIQRALQRARDAQVFPASIEVSEAHWINAARAAAYAKSRSFTDKEETEARHVFLQIVSPHSYLVRDAIKKELLPRLRSFPEEAVESPKPLLRYGLLIFLAGLLVGASPIYWEYSRWPMIMIVVLLVGLRLGKTLASKQHPWLTRSHWIICGLVILTFYLWFAGFWDSGNLMAVVITLIVGEIGVLVTAAFTSKR